MYFCITFLEHIISAVSVFFLSVIDDPKVSAYYVHLGI